jgi:hypothetical protein
MGFISVLFLFGTISFIVMLFMAIFIGIILYTVISYVFESISATCICKKMQYKGYKAAWVPFYNKYLLGKAAENPTFGAVSGVLNLVTVALSIYCYLKTVTNPIVVGLVVLGATIEFACDTAIAHKLYKSTEARYSDVLTIFTILSLGILRPIFLFLVRNKVKAKPKAAENTDALL